MAPPAVSKASHGESYSPLLLSYRWQRRNKFFECFRQKQSEKTNLSHVSFIETFSSFKFGSYWIYFCWLLLKLVAGFWDGGREGRYKNPTPQKFVHHYKVSGKPTDCRAPDLLELNSTFSPDSSSQNYSSCKWNYGVWGKKLNCSFQKIGVKSGLGGGEKPLIGQVWFGGEIQLWQVSNSQLSPILNSHFFYLGFFLVVFSPISDRFLFDHRSLSSDLFLPCCLAGSAPGIVSSDASSSVL